MSCILLLFGWLSDTTYLKSDEEALSEAVKGVALKPSLWTASGSQGSGSLKQHLPSCWGPAERWEETFASNLWMEEYWGKPSCEPATHFPLEKQEECVQEQWACGRWFHEWRQERGMKPESAGCDRRSETKRSCWLQDSCRITLVTVLRWNDKGRGSPSPLPLLASKIMECEEWSLVNTGLKISPTLEFINQENAL